MQMISPRGFLSSLLSLLLPLAGCVDPKHVKESTGGTALYVFDASDNPTSGRILVWNNVSTVLMTPSAPPDRQINGALLDRVKTLGWGGMCMDSGSNFLYFVSESGDVVRIERIRGQSGTLSSIQDIVNFTLGNGSSDRLTNGKFGQASVDPSTGTLYVTECGDSETRIWVVASPWSYAPNTNVARTTIGIQGDKLGYGVAMWQGTVYGHFVDGKTVVGADLTQYSGPRIRKGDATGFQASSGYPIIGKNTQLATYGALAYDAGNNKLFVARHLADASATGAPILVFHVSDFALGLDQAPSQVVGSAAAYPNLRILAHGGNKDWLAAATSNSGAPGPVVYLWRDPLSAPNPVTLWLSGALVRGLTFDWNT